MSVRRGLARPAAIGHGALVLLAADALDLTTSLIPGSGAAPHRPAWLWALQLALAAPLLVLAARRVPAALRWVRALPIPRPALAVLGLFFAAELAHVALRLDRYPFTPVAMFSAAVPPPRDEVRSVAVWVVPGRLGTEIFDFLREGNPFFARFGFDWDYKAAWAMALYGIDNRHARTLILSQLEWNGVPPALAYVDYARKDGSLVRTEIPR